MKRTWTIIGVADVARSFEWYQTLFGQPLTRPAHDDFGQLCDSDGTVLLCLHQLGAHEHPPFDEPRARQAWQRPAVVLSCGRFQLGSEESTSARHSTR